MPPFSIALYGAVVVVLAAYTIYLRFQRGRMLVRVWERPDALAVAGRFAISLLGGFRRKVDWWAIYENGIYLPRQYQHSFLRWEALARADWQGERLILDTGGPMFTRNGGLYELDVPAEKCAEVASALSSRHAQDPS